MTSKICRPRTRSALASWSAASATRWTSAFSRSSAETANSPVVGSRSSAVTMARAWAGLTRPAAMPVARTSWCSSFSASRRSERASRRTCRVSTATQSAALPGAGLDGGLGLLGFGEQPQAQRFALGEALSQRDQRVALLLRGHRPQRHLGQGVELGDQPVGEVGDRVKAVDRLAAHNPIQAPTTDNKPPLNCGYWPFLGRFPRKVSGLGSVPSRRSFLAPQPPISLLLTDYSESVRIASKALRWALAAVVLIVLLVFFEGSFGHDGLLCEWGIDTGPTSDGCGE